MTAYSKMKSTFTFDEFVCFSGAHWFLLPPSAVNKDPNCPICGEVATLNDTVIAHIDPNEKEIL